VWHKRLPQHDPRQQSKTMEDNDETHQLPFRRQVEKQLVSFGGSKTTGHCFRWFANLTGSDERTLDMEAESSSAAEKGISFIPQMMGERTLDWNTSRLGDFHGLTGAPTK
jgi:sugar (pentulose or hexulose) kinase